MSEVQASAAKTHLPQLLVERGDKRRANRAEAIAAIKRLRRGNQKITADELLAMRDEGRQY